VERGALMLFLIQFRTTFFNMVSPACGVYTMSLWSACWVGFIPFAENSNQKRHCLPFDTQMNGFETKIALSVAPCVDYDK
jgi:hypothetical protein